MVSPNTAAVLPHASQFRGSEKERCPQEFSGWAGWRAIPCHGLLSAAATQVEQLWILAERFGVPSGIRTRVTAVKGRMRTIVELCRSLPDFASPCVYHYLRARNLCTAWSDFVALYPLP